MQKNQKSWSKYQKHVKQEVRNENSDLRKESRSSVTNTPVALPPSHQREPFAEFLDHQVTGDPSDFNTLKAFVFCFLLCFGSIAVWICPCWLCLLHGLCFLVCLILGLFFFYFATAFRLVCGESYSQSGGIGWRGHTIHSRSLQTTRS